MSLVEAEYEEEGDLVTLVDNSTALEAINRSEIDIQITTAKRYPRSITTFKRQAMEMATLDEETAGSMFYRIPRGGKNIEGPSVRLAEIIGSSWGNLRYGSRVVATDDRFVTAQGMCFDLEKNIVAAVEVKRRITNSQGVRYNDDMIQVTSNAACAIALRQAIFKVVPFAFVKPLFEAAKQCSIGKATSMKENRAKWIDYFKKLGATEKEVLAMLDRRGVEDVTVEDLITLRGVSNAIKEGELTLESALHPKDGQAGGRARKSELTPTTKAAEKPSGGEPDSAPNMVEIESAFADCADAGQVEALYDSLKGPAATAVLSDAQNDEIETFKVLALQRIKGGKKQKELT